MILCFDTNVVLDLLLRRSPFDVEAEILVAAVERGTLRGCLCATTVTTIDYLVSRHLGRKGARDAVTLLLDLFDIAPVTRAVLADARASRFDDFEDAVLHEAARRAGATGVVTRDPRGFARASLRIHAPKEACATLSLREDLGRYQLDQLEP